MANLEIKYKGSTIASSDTTITKTLKTSGKYCEDDIEVKYTAGGGGSSTDYFWVKPVNSSSTLQVYISGDCEVPNLSYSTDKTNWVIWSTPNTSSLTIRSKTYLKIATPVYKKEKDNMSNDPNFPSSDRITWRLGITGSSDIGGRVMSIIRGVDYTTCLEYDCFLLFYYAHIRNANELVMPTNYPTGAYRGMFYGCPYLTSAPTMPTDSIVRNGSCSYMFKQSNLNTTPVLPATIIESYGYTYMFANTYITTAPSLPATNLASGCYAYMFNSCWGITVAPSLPATSLSEYCYQGMFGGTNITTAPSLPATNLAYGCYQIMFKGCSYLTTPSALPATTLANFCYDSMFENCVHLTSVPTMACTTGYYNSCRYMFKGCISLYISDTLTTEAPYAWTIPSSQTFTGNYTYSNAFTSCLGTRASDDLVFTSGSSITYYTQNEPIS